MKRAGDEAVRTGEIEMIVTMTVIGGEQADETAENVTVTDAAGTMIVIVTVADDLDHGIVIVVATVHGIEIDVVAVIVVIAAGEIVNQRHLCAVYEAIFECCK